MNSRRQVTAALIGLLVLVSGGWFGNQALSSPPGGSRTAAMAEVQLPVRALSQLPPPVAELWQLILRGGPLPYRQDGTVFSNREGRLPGREPGFYREYTVPTPGEPDRGAHRLVTGGNAELYYTGDHSVSFVAVDPQR